jgi:hypothetical protein
VRVLPMGAQHALETRLTGDVDAVVGQARHDPSGRLLDEAEIIDDAQDPRARLLGEGMGRHCPRGRGTTVTHGQAGGLPPLKGAHDDADHLMGWTQPGTHSTGDGDVLDQGLAIFQSSHASSSRWKIASSFFESTSKAAASANALSFLHA